MVKKILADTSILIGLQKGNKEIIDIFSKHKENIFISRITASEFIYGSRDKREKKINKDFLDHLNILDVDAQISVLSYKLIDKYGLKIRLGIADAIVAATAYSHKIYLWTEDVRHLSKIKELRLFKN